MKQLEDMISACLLVESFFKEQGIYSSYHIPFLRRCFYLKKAFLVNKNLRNLNLWRELWPESNTCLEAFQIRFYHRIGYYLANLEYYRLAIGIIKFSDKADKARGGKLSSESTKAIYSPCANLHPIFLAVFTPPFCL